MWSSSIFYVPRAKKVFDRARRGLPPRWRLTVVYSGGTYGRYRLADNRGKDMNQPCADEKDLARLRDLAWLAQFRRGREMPLGAGRPETRSKR